MLIDGSICFSFFFWKLEQDKKTNGFYACVGNWSKTPNGCYAFFAMWVGAHNKSMFYVVVFGNVSKTHVFFYARFAMFVGGPQKAVFMNVLEIYSFFIINIHCSMRRNSSMPVIIWIYIFWFNNGWFRHYY